MGFFYKERYETKNGKKYLVLTPSKYNALARILFIVVVVLVAFLVVLLNLNMLGSNFLKILYILFYILIGLFVIMFCIPFKQEYKPMIARLKRKEVAIKGGTTIFNFKNPPEKWIEQ